MLSTHLIDEMEQLLDHVVILDGGRLVRSGTTEEVTAGAHSLSGPAEAVGSPRGLPGPTRDAPRGRAGLPGVRRRGARRAWRRRREPPASSCRRSASRTWSPRSARPSPRGRRWRHERRRRRPQAGLPDGGRRAPVRQPEPDDRRPRLHPRRRRAAVDRVVAVVLPRGRRRRRAPTSTRACCGASSATRSPRRAERLLELPVRAGARRHPPHVRARQPADLPAPGAARRARLGGAARHRGRDRRAGSSAPGSSARPCWAPGTRWSSAA